MHVSFQQEDWKSIIYCGVENQQIDFKAAQNWNEIGRVGRAKFARHAMALANTLGGYVVIGVGEDSSGNPVLHTGLDEKQLVSFDPSTVGQTINRYADPAVEFDLVKPEVDGRQYVVLVVYPFANLPHVCVDSCNDELQRGVFYIRTPDARSRAADKASELHGLIQRSLRNQRQLLGRMLRGILYEDRQNSEPEAENVFSQVLQESRRQAQDYFGAAVFRKKPMFEGFFYLQNRVADITLRDCRKYIEELQKPSIQDFPWPAPGAPGKYIFAGNNSLRGHDAKDASRPMFYWEFHADGAFYCAVRLQEKKENAIQSSELLQMAYTSVALIGQLFTNAGHGNELLTLQIQINNTMNLSLGDLASQSEEESPICQIPEIIVRKERSAGDLEGGAAADTATQLFQEICERFNVTLDCSECRSLINNIDRKQLQGKIFL